MHRIGPLLAAALLAGAAPVLASPEPGPEAGLGWIYVEANTGGSSGGHLALRVRDTVYHVQQSPGGLFELNRDEWETFRHLYAGLQNRTLAVAELDVSAEDVERVETRLAKAYVAQRAELARRERLALDVAWIDTWRTGTPLPPLAGAGLLAPGAAPDPHAEALRARVRGVHGEGFLAGAIERVDATLAAFEPGAGDLESLREALLLREALVALDEGWALAEGAVLPEGGPLAEPLSDAERRGALHFAEVQQQAVLELLASGRPDRARPLLLAIARHQALARSAQSGRLVLLDAYAGLDELPPERERMRPATAAKLAAELAPLLRDGRPKVLAASDFDEVRYNLLELGAGVFREFEDGARGEPVRRLPRRAIPAAARSVAFTPVRTDLAQLVSAHDAAKRAYAAQEERLLALYRYGVLRRNCVTELARLLNDAFPAGDAARALGAELEPGAGLSFIPFAFFDEATDRLRIERVEPVASHRERELARLLREQPGLLRRFAEATTLGSSVYTPRLRDSTFLFFTDDVLLRRPLLGLANLGWAAGSSLPGLVAAPFDGAARLRAAGAGVWYSLPELLFFNIRKGSFEYVPAQER
jgi:hypothetical protein